jgi:hypothetical protein
VSDIVWSRIESFDSISDRHGEALMDELVKMVADKVGISEAQAKQAVEIVLSFLRDRLPDSMAGQLDAVVDGDLSGLGDLGDLAGGLGGMFGKK